MLTTFLSLTSFVFSAVAGSCSGHEFFCNDMCLSKALVCNGQWNCPNGADERNCGESSGRYT